MEYDYNSNRHRSGASSFDPHIPMYQKLSSSQQPHVSSSSFYPKIGQSQTGQPIHPPARAPPFPPSSAPSCKSLFLNFLIWVLFVLFEN